MRDRMSFSEYEQAQHDLLVVLQGKQPPSDGHCEVCEIDQSALFQLARDGKEDLIARLECMLRYMREEL